MNYKEILKWLLCVIAVPIIIEIVYLIFILVDQLGDIFWLCLSFVLIGTYAYLVWRDL